MVEFAWFQEFQSLKGLGWIERYQTLVVGALGFLGVMATLWVNAWLARKQIEDERRHERRSLRVALITELEINRDTLIGIEKRISNLPEKQSLWVPDDLVADVYKEFIGRIGLLPQTEVYWTLFVYFKLRTYKVVILELGSPRATGLVVDIPSEKVPSLSGLNKAFVEAINEAKANLEQARDANH